jgi:hypothetical protein
MSWPAAEVQGIDIIDIFDFRAELTFGVEAPKRSKIREECP